MRVSCCNLCSAKTDQSSFVSTSGLKVLQQTTTRHLGVEGADWRIAFVRYEPGKAKVSCCLLLSMRHARTSNKLPHKICSQDVSRYGRHAAGCGVSQAGFGQRRCWLPYCVFCCPHLPMCSERLRALWPQIYV